MNKNTHYESNGGRGLNRHDTLPKSEWTPVMWAVHDHLRELVRRLTRLDIDVRIERDRSQWVPGVGNLEFTAEANGDLVVVVGAECLVSGIRPADRVDLEYSLLGAVCEYLAFLDGVPEDVIAGILKDEVAALVEADAEWCAAQQAKLYLAV